MAHRYESFFAVLPLNFILCEQTIVWGTQYVVCVWRVLHHWKLFLKIGLSQNATLVWLYENNCYLMNKCWG